MLTTAISGHSTSQANHVALYVKPWLRDHAVGDTTARGLNGLVTLHGT